MIATERRELVVGTRGSALALAQTTTVCDALRWVRPGIGLRVERITTTGDVKADAPLTALGRGVFVGEIEQALRDRRIDLAVHSAKDMPSTMAPDLTIPAYLNRADARDVLVSRAGTLRQLPSGARVGTSSPRRICQLRAFRPDLEVVAMRGNVDTRLRKLAAGEYDAILLAAAGLLRLGLGDAITEWLDPDTIIPCVGQGALAVQTRADDAGINAMVSALDHAPTRQLVTAERAFLAELGAGCLAPAAAHARQISPGRLALTALIGGLDGRQLTERVEGDVQDAERIGRAIARTLLGRGGAQLMATNDGPLARRRIAITRSDRQAGELMSVLRARGAEPRLYPVIEIRHVVSDEVDRALGRLRDIGWIAFTSANAVEAVASRLGALQLPLPPTTRLAAVGAGTSAVITRLLRTPDFVSDGAGAESLASTLPDVVGQIVLFPCGDLASDALETTLRRRRAEVDRVIVYRTLPAAGARQLARDMEADPVDAVVFASPSSVHYSAEAMRLVSAVRAFRSVCIGHTTAQAASDAGLANVTVAPDASVAGIVSALERALA